MSFADGSLYIKSHHCGWGYHGPDPVLTEKQHQLTLELRFGN